MTFKEIISSNTLVFFLSFLFLSASFSQNNKSSKIFSAEKITGYLFFQDKNLYLREHQGRTYRIAGNLNPDEFKNFFALCEEKEENNSATEASLIGITGTTHAVIDRFFDYSPKGEPAESKEIKAEYTDFELVRVLNAYEKEPDPGITLGKIQKPPRFPMPEDTSSAKIRGVVTKTHFEKIIKSLKIKSDLDKTIIPVIISPQTKTLYIVDGKMLPFTPEEKIKPGSKLDIWAVSRDNIYYALMIVLLTGSK